MKNLLKRNHLFHHGKLARCRYLWVFIVCLNLLAASSSYSYSTELEIVDRIVAIVNDKLITYTQLQDAFKPYETKIREKNYPIDKEMELRFKIRSSLIQQLIDQEITDQEIKKNNITVSDNEIDNYVERIKQMNSFTQEDLRSMLEKDGVTLDQYKKEIRNVILRNKVIQYEIKSKIVVTKKDIEIYYGKHKEEYGQKTMDEVSPLISDKLYQEQADEKFNKWITDLRDQAQIKIIQ